MKRIGKLFNIITSFENLYYASLQARAGKRGKANVALFERNIEEEILQLQAELSDKTYRPGGYREFTIYERKTRKISAAPYRDRVVHHALCRVIEPVFERTFIQDSYACRTGKGKHMAVDRCTEYARKYKYVLKTDIRKYFPSLDHEILFAKIARKIKCRDTLWLIRMIIDGSNAQEEVIEYYPGDDLFAPFQRRRGIPIGNLTSQFFANIYLNDLDHFAEERLGCRAYILYVDDIVVFENDTRRLWEISRDITDFLQVERLTIHPEKTFVQPVTEGIDHLGYRVFPTHRRLRQDNGRKFVKNAKTLQEQYKRGRIGLEKVNATIQSWIGHARHADTYRLREKIFAGIVFANDFKKTGAS